MQRLLYAIFVAIFACSLVLPFAQPVYADTETLRPNAAGDATALNYQWPESGAHWDKVDDVTPDEDSTFVITTYTGYTRDLYNLPAHSIGSGTINSITIYFRIRSNSSIYPAYGKASQKSGAIVTDGTEETQPDTYGTKSQTYTTNPATGSAYTWAEIDALQIGVSLRASSGQSVLCTQVYVEVDYAITVPVVTTSAATNVAVTTATLNGNVTATGGENPTVTVYWGTSDGGANPASWSDNSTPTSPSQPQGVAAFYKNTTGLTKGTTYYFTAKATNSAGTGWATTKSFKTIGDPAITTIAASNVAATTARLNARVDNDGGEACTVEFVYVAGVGPYADYDAINAAGGHVHVNATGTYTTGQTPYYDLSGLTTTPPSDPYWFCASITNSANTTKDGTPQSFTTTSGVNAPTNFKAVAFAESISLLWVKGTGTTNTYIQYKTGTYPTSKTDGTNAYNGVESTHQLTGLIVGTTYYFIAWGLSGTTYSSDNITLMATTSATITVSGQMPSIAAPSNWFTTSNPTVFSKLPIYGTINWVWNAYQIPPATGWFIIGLVLALLGGIGVYAFSHKIIVALFAETGFLVIFSMMGMIPLFLVFLCAVFAIGTLVIGQRV